MWTLHVLVEQFLKPKIKSVAQLVPNQWHLALVARQAVSFRYFLFVFRANHVDRETDRMQRPSANTHRQIFDTLSININCSFLRTVLRGC
ncbi:MAG: hypothetical protein ACPGGK_13435 [Pikeienuella sp.]